MMYLYGINKILSKDIVLAATLDFIITLVAVGLFLFFLKNKIKNIVEFWRGSYSDKSSYLLIYLLNSFFFLILFYYSPQFLVLIIQGVTRQALFDNFGGYPFLLSMADKYFLVTSVFILLSSAPKMLKNFTLLGFVVATTVMTSRSNLMFFLMFLIIYNLLFFKPSTMVKLFKLISFFIFLAVFFGIFVQNRSGESAFLGPLKPVEDLFLYQSYSMYLAQISSSFASEHGKYFYPFLGYFSDYFHRAFGGEHMVDSNFVIDFHIFNSDVRAHSANVLYPWWSWFYGAYGYAGLIFKMVYMLFLLYSSIALRLFPLFLLFLYWILFSGYTKIPFLTLDAFILLLFVMLISLIPKVKLKNSKRILN